MPITPRQLTALDHSVSWKVEWRLGGTRAGDRQSLTFSEAKLDDAEDLARRAALLIDAHNYNLTRQDAYRQLVGDDGEGLPSVLTLNAFFDGWIERKTGIEAGVRSRYRGDWALHMAGDIGHLPLADITTDAVQEWVLGMEAKPATRGGTKAKPKKKPGRPRAARSVKPLSARTIVKHHSLLHQVLAAAARSHRDLLAYNPAADSELPSTESGRTRETRVFLTREEADLLLAGFSADWARDMIDVAFRTGLRWSELTALQVADLIKPGKRGKRGAIRIQRAWKMNGKRWELVAPGPEEDEVDDYERVSLGPPKSKRSRRTITLDGHAYEILRRYCAGKGPMELIFPSSTGTMIGHANFMTRHWRPAVKRAKGIDPETGKKLPREELRDRQLLTSDPTPHSCRHSHASWLILAGWTVERVSLRLGHDSRDFTYRTYVHFISSDDEDLDAALG